MQETPSKWPETYRLIERNCERAKPIVQTDDATDYQDKLDGEKLGKPWKSIGAIIDEKR